jgi:DNA-binding transcriptional LysR family regulator
VAFECDDLSVVHGFVAAGLGVAIVPAMDAGPQPSSPGAARLIRLTNDGAHRDVGLAWSHARRLLPSAELFRRHVLAARQTTSAELIDD